MKKKLTAFYIFLSLLGIAAAIGIFILGFAALQKADSTKEHVEQTLAQAEEKKNQLTEQQKSQQQTQKEQNHIEDQLTFSCNGAPLGKVHLDSVFWKDQ